MRIALAIQIRNANLVYIAVEVDDSLVLEIGVIILSIELECLTKQRYVHLAADAIVPCFLLFQVVVDDESSAACQEIVVLSKSMY